MKGCSAGTASTRMVVVVGIVATISLALGSVAASAKKPPPRPKTVVAPASLIAAAKQEGSLTFYGAAIAAQQQNLINAFEKKYGITVNATVLPSAPLITRIDAEVASGNVHADVIDDAAHLAMEQLVTQNALAPINALPMYKWYPAHYRFKYWIIAGVNVWRIVYNKDLATAADFKGYPDLLNAKWKGQITAVDPRTSPAVAAGYVVLRKKFGDTFLPNFAAQQPTYFHSGVTVAQLVASGEKTVGMFVVSSAVVSLLAAGAPIGIVDPAPTMGPEHFFGMMAKAPHPAAARLFMDFMMANAGQAAFNGYGMGVSPVAGIRGINFPSQYVPSFTPSDAQTNLVYQALGLQ